MTTPTLSVSEAALVLKPAAVRYLRAVACYNTPREADHAFVVAAEEADGVGALVNFRPGDTVVGERSLTPRGRAILAHMDGCDGEDVEDAQDILCALRRIQDRAHASVRTWGDVRGAGPATFGTEGVTMEWIVRHGAHPNLKRVLVVEVHTHGTVRCTLYGYVFGKAHTSGPLVACTAGNTVAEALEALGSPGQGL